MKRSSIEESVNWAKKLAESNNVNLPDFAVWSIEKWKQNAESAKIIFETKLGWDVTDFTSDDFDRVGCVLFTSRNGSKENVKIGTPYAEKYIFIKEGQILPMHFHYDKTEDIINRCGGVMVVELYNANKDLTVDYKSDVSVVIDGIESSYKAGELIYIYPGNSITLTPYMYHSFGAAEGKGELICGEISSVNEDNKDNHFAQKIERFSSIEENVPMTVILCNEYSNLM